jgi:thiol-disulfide isomerase/thioredoxin
MYWRNRARLARYQKRPAEALTWYQKAIHTRPKPDAELEGEARTLFNQVGGSEEAWRAWKALAKRMARALETASGWEKPAFTIPKFELPDLQGKTWRLTQHEGKSVFINVWATWCGPCLAELPFVQKLHERVKDRSDVLLLTFNIDDQVALVEPFVKERAYTFPVLLAKALVEGMLDTVGIPRNWIIDAKGELVLDQRGFNPATAEGWDDEILQLLEKARDQLRSP